LDLGHGANEATRRRSIRPLCERTFVAHPAYIRDKAVQLRVERDLTIDEIAERLAISRQTIAYWVRDIPLRRVRRTTAGQHIRNRGNALRYKELRDAAYEEGWMEFEELVREPSFRDFVCMYIGEGSSAIGTRWRSATRTPTSWS